MVERFYVEFTLGEEDDELAIVRVILFEDRWKFRSGSIALKTKNAKRLKKILEKYAANFVDLGGFGTHSVYVTFDEKVSAALKVLLDAIDHEDRDLLWSVLSAILEEDWEQAVAYRLLL